MVDRLTGWVVGQAMSDLSIRGDIGPS